MRILIATPLYPPDVGGPATYTRLLEEELPKCGIEVVVVKWSEVAHKPKIVRHFSYFQLVFRLGRDVDLIFAQDPVSVGLPAFVAAQLLRKRFVLKVVGDFAWEQWMQRLQISDFRLQNGEQKQDKKKAFVDVEEFQRRRFDLMTELRRFVERFVARRAERVIVPSEYLKRIVQAWGVPPERITVVYNSFDPPRATLDKSDARRVLGVSGTIIFSAGRLVPWKGMQALVALMSDIVKKFPDAHLFIAGEGPEKQALALQIADCRLQNYCTLLGRLDHETLYRYITAVDLFVLNTGYEGLSHQLLEVMALGAPIVTTNVGGNPELIEDGQSGRLVAYGDSATLLRTILELLSHPPAGGKLASAAQKKSQEFSRERMIRETVAVFNLHSTI
jgi:glycosyltransferase involved in cell wall biosynthesis